MRDTDWFAERQEDQQERCFRWRVGFAIFAALATALVLIPMLAGCSSVPDIHPPDNKICFVQLIGKTEEGWSVLAERCMTPEQFEASQK